MGQTKLPYIYNDYKTGYQLELVDAVLKKAGHRAFYTPTEHARNEKLLLNTNLYGVMNIDEFHVEAIFEPTDVHILFKEEAIQEDFDRELYEFVQSEKYLNLRQKYLGNNSLFTFK